MTLWTTAIGAWGDIFVSCGNIIKLLREEGRDSCSTVYFGLDDNIKEFLEYQDFIDEVYHLKLGGEHLFDALMYQAQHDYSRWLSLTKLDALSSVPVRTHVTPELVHSSNCFRDFDLKLPPRPRDQRLPESFLLFQPYSIQSNTEATHWPYWMVALEWILDNTDYHVVMVGRDGVLGSPDPNFSTPKFKHPRVTDLVNETSSMMDVLNMASLAKGIISTANALPIWCIIKKIPALVVYNLIIKEKAPYFYQWYKADPVMTLESDSGVIEFAEGFTTYMNSLTRKK